MDLSADEAQEELTTDMLDGTLMVVWTISARYGAESSKATRAETHSEPKRDRGGESDG
mgnify:CR=1 FL=1